MTSPDASYDVVVIGAGLAGLVATYELLHAGHKVLCVEARDRVGGRAFSINSAEAGIDLGATWFWENELRVRSMLETLGLASFPQSLAGDALFDTGQDGSRRLHGNPVGSPSLRFERGAHSLPIELARRLPEGSLALNEPVEAITVDGDDVQILTHRRELSAQRVVLAVPPALAAESIEFVPVLPHDLKELCKRTAVWMGGMIKAVAVYPGPFWRRIGLSGSAISHSGPFREFHDHSGPGGEPAAIFGFAPCAGLPRQGTNAIAHAFNDQLVRLFGADASNPTEIHVMDWSAEPYTQPRNQEDAGTSSYGNPLFQQPIHNRVHWASTETATAYAGHLEGAAIAGRSAAQAITISMDTRSMTSP
ncbi:flavin monoamine oxidase family protein [Arthrobacter sp. SLBN-122]|uniref:flavin monoamine oxidase family protein n=1 Tax=Arthrobacter sp. SLBN-122 TaxID=2768455 RepID=UPI00115320A9|nr:NAD(P)/FAD-dependent oxidoreductase [Arthrobacter sp. SLBN-122]TQJ34213.1 monoamine oxidase [Arthrobacter sp. SLBN-122]